MLGMMDNGRRAMLAVKGHFIMQMEISTMVHGLIINVRVMVYILTKREQDTKVIGKMTHSPAKVLKNGQKARSMLEHM